MKNRLIGLLAIAFILTASALTVPAQLDDLPKMPHKKEPPGALPDLRIESAVFRFSSAEVVIKNTGNGTSPKAQLEIQIYATTEPKSPVKWNLMHDIPSLAPGKEYKTSVKMEYASLTFNGHARRIVIDPHGLIAERDKRNNQLFSNTPPEADEGSFPEPAQFDLLFTGVKFISPGKVHYCVKNAGPAESGLFDVKITIFNGPQKTSGLYAGQTDPIESLSAGQVKCFDSDISTTTPGEEIFVGRGRLIEIVTTGSDYNKTNNSYFEPALQPPWTH